MTIMGQIKVTSDDLAAHATFAPITITGGVLADECKQLFHDWKKLPTARTY